ANRVQIPFGPLQAYAQSRLSSRISKQSCFRSILCHDQIGSPVLVIIRRRRAALFAVDQDPALLSGHHTKAAISVAFQEQTTTRVISRSLRLRGEKVLAQKNVLVAIAIEIRDANR